LIGRKIGVKNIRIMPIECEVEFQALSRVGFQKLDYAVMREAFACHKDLGRSCDESIYRNDLALRCAAAMGCEVRSETLVRVSHGGFSKDYRIDLIVDGSSVYELKAARAISPDHEGQALNYLHLVGCEHGKIINFGTESVESRFVNNPVPTEDRREFETHFADWNGPEALTSAVIAFVEDVGLFLENALYNQALLHHFGGADHALERRPMRRRDHPLGHQTFQMCAPDEGFRVTSLHTQLQAQMATLEKLLILSDLKALHWINLNHHRIEFRTIRP
jgi:GxxExxY protein